MANIELLIGPDAFWRRAEPEIRAARRRVLVQAMTFEGDATGLAVAAALRASRAADRRILVDRFTKFVVSDRFVWAPLSLLDAGLRAEVRETGAMFAAMAEEGIGVRWTNPPGPFLWRFPLRNHKKLVLADDAVYVGGVNFSDHNFAWDDVMLRVEQPDVADFFAHDFDATYEGRPAPAQAEFGDLSVHSLDGRANARGFAPLMTAIERAARSVTVVSPYLTFPFTGALGAARRRGVAVDILTPRDNNKPTVMRSLLRDAARYGFTVHLMPGMQHTKGLVVDEEMLFLGSSNFDFVSYQSQEEYFVVVCDPSIVEAFRDRIVRPGLAAAGPPAPDLPSGGIVGAGALRIGSLYSRMCRKARRGVVADRHG